MCERGFGMRGRSALWLLLSCVPALAATSFSFHVSGDDPGSWPDILKSVGFIEGVIDLSGIFVFPAGSDPEPEQWLPRIEQGAYLVLEGDSRLAWGLGFRPGEQKVAVRSLVDEHNPKLPIVWEQPLRLPVYSTPGEAQVFAKERWKGYPLIAGFRRGQGAVLWVAASPGKRGYERFPYLLHALGDLGLPAPVRSSRLWAFFDSSYRTRVDVDWFAERWRKTGIAGLHIAGWQYFEPDEARDAWLRKLIAACHRNAILVYVWLELPHVSEKFWQDHPEWREKTAIGQDAHLDWRRLMNLANRDCFRQASRGVRELLHRFDWDGVNLAELYFESLEGASNPARFTPLNEDVRAEFQRTHGFDPLDLFQGADPARMPTFLEFRASLAHRMQEEWIEQIEEVRREQPHLELVLTHVDDRFDTTMRDKIGADVARLLPSVEKRDVTFLIEDPATVWNLGPQRYPEIRKRYDKVTTKPERLAIDINIVERYQDVYPTKQQTGTELFQLVHLASGVFSRVALYFEQSLLAPDLPMLPAAGAVVRRMERAGGKLVVESPYGVGVPWRGPANVNGRLWPVANDSTLWLPAGAVAVEPADSAAAVRILDYNAELKVANSLPDGVELSYESRSRAFFVLSARPGSIDVDGAAYLTDVIENRGGYVLALPRGQHLVEIRLSSKRVAD